MSRIRSSAHGSPGLWPHLALLLLLLPLLLLPPGAAMAQDADHLLISEVVVQTRSPIDLFGSPFIEITNPTAAAVDLSDVYLTTAQDATLGRLYWNVVVGQGAGGGTGGNVHGRFPAGMSLAAGDTLVISINGSGQFNEAYGYLPDLELFEDGAVPDQVPEMVEIFTGSIGAGLGSVGTNTPALSTSYDSIVLYQWDGASDLVQDLDYFIYGADTRVRVDKTGVTVGSSTYLADTAAASQTSVGSAATFGSSHARLGAVESGETAGGGNGATGHDETSETLNVSWETASGQDPATAPASWHPAAPIVLDAGNGGAAPDAPVNVQAELVAYDTVTDVTIHYSADGGAWLDVAASAAGGNDWAGQIPGQPADTVVQWYLTAAGSGGGAVTWPVEGENDPESYTVISGGTGEVVKLLFSEISITNTDREYVEIANPSLNDVDLGDYYLSDAIYADGSQYYWRIAEGNPGQTTVGGGDFFDFHARFPAGYTLAAGDTVVVSIAGSDAYYAAFGFLPHIELYEDGPSPDAVPDMRPVFGTAGEPDNSINGQTNPSLTDTDESLTLYYWDGLSNLVTDIDIFFWDSDGSGQNSRYSKTGVSVNGETFQDETALGAQQPYTTAISFGNSFHRTDASEGAQPGPPGNGVGGRDEVGEDWPNTFTILPYDPSIPVLDAPQILSAVASRAYTDQEITVRATVASADPLASVLLYYTLDGGDEVSVASVDGGDGSWDAVIPGQPLDTVITWRFVAEDIEGDQGVWPGGGGVITVTVVDAPDPDTQAQHLLLTEVRTRGAEFFEIHNPLDRDVPLDQYYVTDAIYAFGSQLYWRITEGNPSQETVGGGAYDDFHGQFPSGAVIAAGQTITVALAGSDGFYAEYYQDPDYELFEDGDEADDIPDLVEVFPGSLAAVQEPYGNPPGFSNGAEIVVLYWWDGVDDLVTDVDVFFWDNTGTDGSTRFSKNGVTSGSSSYGPELTVAQQQPYLDPAAGLQSFTRREADETGEDQGGFGNGVGGHDETSEVFMDSFDLADASPGQFVAGGGEGQQGEVALQVPPRTFVPDLEVFPIEFTTRNNAETKIRIIDMEGRVVKTVYDSRFDGPASTVPGVYTQRPWDGRDATYEKVRAGTYVIHMQAVDRTTGDMTVKTAPVVVATRLK